MLQQFHRARGARLMVVEGLEERRLLSALAIPGQQTAAGATYTIGTLTASVGANGAESANFSLVDKFRNIMSDANGQQFRFLQVITFDDQPVKWNGSFIAPASAANHTRDAVDPPSGGWDYESTNGGGGADTSPFYENDTATNAGGTPYYYGGYDSHHSADGTDPGMSMTDDMPGLTLPNYRTLFETFITYVDSNLIGPNKVDVLGGYSWGVTSNAANSVSGIAASNISYTSITSGVLAELQAGLNRSGFSGWTVVSNDVIIPPPKTINVPLDSSTVILTGARPMWSIMIQANVSTATDPNENGEGEPLVLASSGGFSATDTSFDVNVNYDFTASVKDESVTASIPNADQDESGTVTATYSAVPFSNVSPALQMDLASAAGDLNTAAAGLGAVAGSLGSGSSLSSQGASNAAWVTVALLGAISADFTNLSIDPVDTNFTQIAVPAHPTTAIFSHANDFKGLKNAGSLAASIDALDTNLERSIGLVAAAYITANRVDGATAAGNAHWAARQASALKMYKKQEAVLLAAEIGLLQGEAAQFTKAGLGTTSVASSDVQSFEQGVLDSGLPAQLVTALNKLGIDAATQSQIQQALFVQDTSAASGTYVSLLTNSALENDIRQTAAMLKTG